MERQKNIFKYSLWRRTFLPTQWAKTVNSTTLYTAEQFRLGRIKLKAHINNLIDTQMFEKFTDFVEIIKKFLLDG